MKNRLNGVRILTIGLRGYILSYTGKVETHLSKITVAVQELIDIQYSHQELEQICNEPSRIIVNLETRKKMNKPDVSKIKMPMKSRINEPKAKREKLSTKKLKLVKTGLSYQDYLDRSGYIAPDLTNIY